MMSDQPVIPAIRPTYSDEIMDRSFTFAQDMLRLIPELEGVAVVPSYTIPQDRLPFGIVVGRRGPLRNPDEIMHMATQVHGVLKIHLDNAFECMRLVDNEMSVMQARIAVLQETIRERTTTLSGLDQQLASRANAND
jgi:hypothetical protein